MAKTNKIQQTKKALLKALELSLGNATESCRMVGINRSTFYDYIKKDDQFAQDVKEIENAALDFVESKLFDQIQNNSTAATIFYLKTKGRRRGYIEVKYINQDDNEDKPIQVMEFGGKEIRF